MVSGLRFLADPWTLRMSNTPATNAAPPAAGALAAANGAPGSAGLQAPGGVTNGAVPPAGAYVGGPGGPGMPGTGVPGAAAAAAAAAGVPGAPGQGMPGVPGLPVGGGAPGVGGLPTSGAPGMAPGAPGVAVGAPGMAPGKHSTRLETLTTRKNTRSVACKAARNRPWICRR